VAQLVSHDAFIEAAVAALVQAIRIGEPKPAKVKVIASAVVSPESQAVDGVVQRVAHTDPETTVNVCLVNAAIADLLESKKIVKNNTKNDLENDFILNLKSVLLIII